MSNAAIKVQVGEHQVRLGPHAVERYQERVRPTLSLPSVHTEARNTLPSGTIANKRPTWITTYSPNNDDAWLLLGDDVAFPLIHDKEHNDLFALTCLTKGSGLDDHGVHRRRARRAKRRDRRQSHERKANGEWQRETGRRPTPS